MESHRRTLAKAISYRILGVIATTVVALIITGQPRVAIGVGVADSLSKFFVYYAHERAWNRIGFGRPKVPEYEI